MLFQLCLLASLLSNAVSSNVRSQDQDTRLKMHGPIRENNGGCLDSGPFQNGNHCVLMKGKALDDFVEVADPGSYDEQWLQVKHDKGWCVCLHDYLHIWGKGQGDESACSAEAMAAN